MIRIAYFVHGRGKGHAVRARAVTANLRTSYDVHLFCAGEAWDLLSDLPCSEPVLDCLPGKGMARSFGLRLRRDRKRLRSWAPDLLVSDGDGPSVHAASSLGIPVVAVGHGLVFRHTHVGESLPFGSRAREVLNAASSSWPARRRVAVHFAPTEPRTPGTHVARPDLRTDIVETAPREDFILGYFRDENGIEALEQVARRGHRVLLFGQPRSVPRGVEVHPLNMSGFSEALGRCRAVIGSAGNHLPAECAMLGLPMLVLHRADDSEHAMNARLVEAAGIGIGSSFEGCTAEVIRRFEAEFDLPREDLAARTRAMRPASLVVPEAIDELCDRPARHPSYGGVASSWK